MTPVNPNLASGAGRRIEIRGTVQGVGFRPWVYRLARGVGVRGRVRNDAAGVTIEAFGAAPQLDELCRRLRAEPPPAAEIRALDWRPIETDAAPAADDGFAIVDSAESAERRLSIPPDLATCEACRRELFDPGDRRHRYPFTNCTDCGPRFTIATGVPYDRPATTMAVFRLCPECGREYRDPLDRRFHAQPNACPACGPRLRLVGPRGDEVAAADPLRAAARALRAELIVAVKGIGGFHLACDATSELAVNRLRERKRRPEKPFAVMMPDLETAHRVAFLGAEEERLLASVERPIVLAERCPAPDAVAPDAVTAAVAPGIDLLGLLLPYSPLHHLLLEAVGRPLVMTSGNLSGEPIARADDEAVDRLGKIADLFLLHDREIAVRCDDSVAQVVAGAPTVIRRSRGWVPRPIPLARPCPRPVLACGAHLKNTFCLAVGDAAYLGPHVGDLDSLESCDALAEAVDHLERLLRVTPEVIAHDLHPEYLSTVYARRRPGRKVAVQHHHAHVASALAEHRLDGPVYGVAFDGTGLGTDGTAWGGEILFADAAGFERLAALRPLRLAGGDRAVREVWRLALALLDDAFDGAPPLDRLALFRDLPERPVSVVRQLLRRGVQAPPAHGAGRYFDAVGALLLARPEAYHEGQVALAANRIADPGEGGVLPWGLDSSATPWRIDLRPAVRELVGALLRGASPAVLSARFHNTLATATAEVVRALVAVHGRRPAVLTGGCFQNPLLTSRLLAGLAPELEVYRHRRVPPGDGGIALGQVLVASATVGDEP